MSSHEVQIRAILARFNGCIPSAVMYCVTMAHDYPELAMEYNKYKTILLNKMYVQIEP